MRARLSLGWSSAFFLSILAWRVAAKGALTVKNPKRPSWFILSAVPRSTAIPASVVRFLK